MKTFIVSMAFVVTSAALVANLKKEPDLKNSVDQPTSEKIAKSMSSHFTQKIEPKRTKNTSYTEVSTTIQKTTPEQLAKKMSGSEQLELQNLKNQKTFTVTSNDLRQIGPGTYVTKYKDRYYKITNVRTAK